MRETINWKQSETTANSEAAHNFFTIRNIVL